MKVAIIGYSGSGKTTCFKAITQKKDKDFQTLDPARSHLQAVKLSDPRLDVLKEIFHPKKITPVEVVFEDTPGWHPADIKDKDMFLEVVGMFSGRDVIKDIADIEVEFMLSDKEIIDHRLHTLDKELKASRFVREKQYENEVLNKCRTYLERNIPLRKCELNENEKKVIRGFQFLSLKPLVILGNIDETQKCSSEVEKLKEFCKEQNFLCVEFCAKLESEIAELEEGEKEDFLREMGIEKSARDAVLEALYKSGGFITFFTVKGDETKAWTVKEGTNAVEAAGKIHSDIKRGFIRAEVVNIKELIKHGSISEVKKNGLLRLEGKEYKICDGDIIDFRFNV